MTTLHRESPAFKRAVIFSFTAHILLFLLAIFSPRLPKFSQKKTIYYVNAVSFPGGGGGGGGGSGGIPGGGSGGGKAEQVVETAAPVRETLRDLTPPPRLEQESPSTLRHPVEKPKREPKPRTDKKAVIQKQQPTATKTQPDKTEGSGTGVGSGTGSGLTIGIGSGGGGGFGSEYASQIGTSTFPFTYYLQILHSKISSNWVKSQISPGISGSFHSTVYFKIHKDGQISELKVVEQSGVRSLDLSAMRAIRSAAPFPPLPDEYEDEYLGIRLIFEHNI
jgi:TonB family protein